MRKDKIYLRVCSITDLLSRGEGWTCNEISEQLKEPKGTISPFISAMLGLKHLIQTKEGLYKLPDWPKRNQVVAEDLKKFFRNKYLKHYNKTKEERQPLSQLKIEVEKTRSELREIISAHASEIESAIELLKSNGYKVLKPTTEFKEV